MMLINKKRLLNFKFERNPILTGYGFIYDNMDHYRRRGYADLVESIFSIVLLTQKTVKVRITINNCWTPDRLISYTYTKNITLAQVEEKLYRG